MDLAQASELLRVDPVSLSAEALDGVYMQRRLEVSDPDEVNRLEEAYVVLQDYLSSASSEVAEENVEEIEIEFTGGGLFVDGVAPEALDEDRQEDDRTSDISDQEIVAQSAQSSDSATSVPISSASSAKGWVAGILLVSAIAAGGYSVTDAGKMQWRVWLRDSSLAGEVESSRAQALELKQMWETDAPLTWPHDVAPANKAWEQGEKARQDVYDSQAVEAYKQSQQSYQKALQIRQDWSQAQQSVAESRKLCEELLMKGASVSEVEKAILLARQASAEALKGDYEKANLLLGQCDASWLAAYQKRIGAYRNSLSQELQQMSAVVARQHAKAQQLRDALDQQVEQGDNGAQLFLAREKYDLFARLMLEDPRFLEAQASALPVDGLSDEQVVSSYRQIMRTKKALAEHVATMRLLPRWAAVRAQCAENRQRWHELRELQSFEGSPAAVSVAEEQQKRADSAMKKFDMQRAYHLWQAASGSWRQACEQAEMLLEATRQVQELRDKCDSVVGIALDETRWVKEVEQAISVEKYDRATVQMRLLSKALEKNLSRWQDAIASVEQHQQNVDLLVRNASRVPWAITWSELSALEKNSSAVQDILNAGDFEACKNTLTELSAQYVGVDALWQDLCSHQKQLSEVLVEFSDVSSPPAQVREAQAWIATLSTVDKPQSLAEINKQCVVQLAQVLEGKKQWDIWNQHATTSMHPFENFAQAHQYPLNDSPYAAQLDQAKQRLAIALEKCDYGEANVAQANIAKTQQMWWEALPDLLLAKLNKAIADENGDAVQRNCHWLLLRVPEHPFATQVLSEWVILYPFEEDQRWGFRDEHGTVWIAACYDEVGPFSEGLAKVRSGAFWGFVNRKGKLLGEGCQWGAVQAFSDGMAAVSVEGFWGYINRQGDLVIDVQFNQAESFYDGTARVHLGGEVMRVDRTGRILSQEEK